MSRLISAGSRFRSAVKENHPLHIVGTINAFSALLAQQCGHKAIYLSGSGVATASFGLPDLGITTMNDVIEDARRITSCCDVPLLVDIDTGFGGAFNISRCIREMERIGVAAVHIEDQINTKRCGHRPNKQVVSTEEMMDRIKAACNARIDPDFVIMARTDALAVENLESAIERAKKYVEAGADMIFAEACTTLVEYEEFVKQLPGVPILANLTEFGKTPLFTDEELKKIGIGMVLHPLSAFRAMAKAAEVVYSSIAVSGTVAPVMDTMQTRSELYKVIHYHDYEKELDKYQQQENNTKRL